MKRAYDERKADKDHRENYPRWRIGNLDAGLHEPVAQPAVGRIECCQRDAGDRRGQRERQIDKRIEQAASRESVTYQHPCDQQAEADIDDGRQDGATETEFECRQRTR